MGKGGYSEVYKGELENGEMVAVKKLTKGNNEEKREREFLTELGTIGHACHPNVSSLLGCCIDNGLYLLFPFSPRGSVSSVLHGKFPNSLSLFSFSLYSNYRVDFGLGVLDRFEIIFYVHIVFYIIVNYFLSRVKLNSIIKSDKFRVIKIISNTSTFGKYKF